jgi:hypothetical protein
MKSHPAIASLKSALVLAASLLTVASPLRAAEGRVLFEQAFDKLPAGELPADFLVLNGVFAVVEETGGKCVELPGSPLEDFGFLFGPSEAAGVEASARILSTKQGRKFPTFALGVNGGGGFKIRVAPAKKAIELLKGEEIVKSVPFDWKSGEWMSLKLRVRKIAEGIKVEARAWQGTTEPGEWTLVLDEKEALPAGKSGVWGMPYAGTAIRFDDLKVTALAP